jgi:putative membrane protein
MLSIIVSAVIGMLLYALAIWVVGKFGLGLKVSGFGPAFMAAIVISVASYLIIWLLGVLGLSFGGGFMGAIIHLIVAALVLMFAGNMVKGLRVKGFVPAVIGAIAIAFVSWLIDGIVGTLF